MTVLHLSRLEVRAVDCPECRAPAGEPCVGPRGKPRESNHRSRLTAAEEHVRATLAAVGMRMA
jgi:hypothetical protein